MSSKIKTKASEITQVILYFLLTIPLALIGKVAAEPTAPKSFMPSEMIAAPGETKNNSLTTGTRAVLSFGTSTSFGSSANVSSSSGYNVQSVSEVKPTKGSFAAKFGDGDQKGVITAVVGNIRSAGSGTFEGDNFSVESDDTSAAEGSATMTGIETAISLDFDKSSFTSTTIKPSETITTDTDGNSSTKLLMENDEELHTANGGATTSMQNNIDVNVSNSTFNQAFSQAF